MELVMRRRSRSDLIFDLINYACLTIGVLLILYPLYFVLIASISDPNAIYAGEVYILPKHLTFDGYSRILQDKLIWSGYANSILYAVVGTAISVSITLMAAYPLSRKDLYGKTFITWFLLFTTFFNGGLIPTYLLIKSLGMVNTMWALVLPGAAGVFNIIIVRTFIQNTIPDEMREAAAMDGCSDTTFFVRIVLPLSKPVIAVMVLFHTVGFWNSFFDALIYLNSDKLWPLQLVLRNILVQNQVDAKVLVDVDSYLAKMRVTELIKYGVIIISSGPLLVLYPFLQRYFVKGVLIGSIKG
ncbi:carbohydrate ABC transporter permease [Paenibacillus oleatilyticus]|uniref:carbohydrate ABC transporter permease n=1 Tax=Paenibacillus oleatilyticus TaxID=2594886 RepID=UPI001C1F2AA3|nr:carbohydrate ABC transporter permease [Paenibacillus oleatilyticus]MBU7316626.1 carbohydrate ABC transporter permease [Paenibacillus oleatilyticus]